MRLGKREGDNTLLGVVRVVSVVPSVVGIQGGHAKFELGEAGN
jgi:hypothetical protein